MTSQLQPESRVPSPEPRSIPGSNVPPTAAESAVYDELHIFHRSSKYPLSIARLSMRTGMNDREIKAAVEGLRLRHGVVVGALRGNPCGYFLAETAADIEIAWKPMFHQTVQMWRVIHAMNGRSERRLHELLGQMQLEVCNER